MQKAMTNCYNRHMLSGVSTGLLLGILLLTNQLQGARVMLKPSACDLRERPDKFNHKVVQTSGWIYTDIERFGLEEQSCGVALRWAENPQTTKDVQAKRFAKLLKASKRNPFETEGKLFVILQGEFETAMVRKDGQLVLEGSVRGGSGSAPSILTIQKIVCSVLAPANSTSKMQAIKRCQQ
jgi:hypothetical protein